MHRVKIGLNKHLSKNNAWLQLIPVSTEVFSERILKLQLALLFSLTLCLIGAQWRVQNQMLAECHSLADDPLTAETQIKNQRLAKSSSLLVLFRAPLNFYADGTFQHGALEDVEMVKGGSTLPWTHLLKPEFGALAIMS